MPLGRTREKIVYGLARKRGGVHRYTLWRWGVALAGTVLIAAIPLSGALRFDLWGGRHVLLGREVSFAEAVKAFAYPFLALNLAILVASRFLGRYLCGFGCPYGSLARLAEWLRFRGRTRAGRIAGVAVLGLSCVLLAAIVFVFWVDVRVFAHGSPFAIAASAAFFAGTAAILLVAAWKLGLRFCRDWCPSGVYFALLGHDTLTAIELAYPEACTDCKACERSCPMDLAPRVLSSAPQREGAGLYPDGLSSYSLCIRCGDCVAACEVTTAKNGPLVPLRLGPLSRGASARANEPARPAEMRPLAGERS